MPFFDLSLTQLEEYKPELTRPADFDNFWSETIAQSQSKAKPIILSQVDLGLSLFDTFDTTFSGFNGEPIKAWFVQPKQQPITSIIVEYNGYGGGRGFPHERLNWAGAGFGYLFMDTRGQGSSWGSGGSTDDPHGGGAHHPGFMTKGITDKNQYYYRRLITDSVLAVSAVRSLDLVSPGQVAVTGVSQGGGLAAIVAGLIPDLLATMPDVPFLSNIRRAVGLTNKDPYAEIERYLSIHRDQVELAFNTLDYFDAMNFVINAKAPALFSVALMDDICPPSTVYAAKNHYRGSAEIQHYDFNNHEGGAGFHWINQIEWLRGIINS